MLYIPYFIIGGLLFTLIKYLSINIKDTRYASTIAAFPIGLLTIILVSNNKSISYSKNYCINLIILFITALVNYFMLHYFNKITSLIISIIFWLIINFIFIKFI